VAFVSLDAQLCPDDHNQNYDVFLRDPIAATTQLISKRAESLSSLTSVGLVSTEPNSVSADGRFVVFISGDGDLAAGDTNRFRDVFVRRPFYRTRRLSSAPGRTVFQPMAIAAGRALAAMAATWSLCQHGQKSGAGKKNGNYYYAPDVFRRDLLTGTTTLVSLRADGTGSGAMPQPHHPSTRMEVWWWFESSRKISFLGMIAPAGRTNVYGRRFTDGTNFLVSVTLAGGVDVNADSFRPVMSRDGRWVAFISKSSLLTANASNPAVGQLCVRDLVTKTTIQASVNPPSQGNGDFGLISFSADNRFMAFDLLNGAVAQRAVLIHDLLLRTNTIGFTNNGKRPVLNGNGELVVYEITRSGNIPQQIGITDLPAPDKPRERKCVRHGRRQ